MKKNPPLSRPVEWTLASLLLLCLAAQLAVAIRADGMTVDEMVYIGCGYRHLVYSDFHPSWHAENWRRTFTNSIANGIASFVRRWRLRFVAKAAKL